MDEMEKLLRSRWVVELSFDQHYQRCCVSFVNPFTTERVQFYDEDYKLALAIGMLEAIKLSKEIPNDNTI